MPELVVYSRPGCHLCELLLEEIGPLIRGRATLVVQDIDTRPDWQAAYGDKVPVVEADGRELCRYHLDRDGVTAPESGDCDRLLPMVPPN